MKKIWKNIKVALGLARKCRAEVELPANYRPECVTELVEVRGNKIAMIQDFGEGVKVIVNIAYRSSVMFVGDELIEEIDRPSLEDQQQMAYRAERRATQRRRARQLAA